MRTETPTSPDRASRPGAFRRFAKILGIALILAGAAGSLAWLAFTIQFFKDPARFDGLMTSWLAFLKLQGAQVVIGGAPPVMIGPPVAMALMLVALLVVALMLGLMIRSGIVLVDFAREKRPATPEPSKD